MPGNELKAKTSPTAFFIMEDFSIFSSIHAVLRYLKPYTNKYIQAIEAKNYQKHECKHRSEFMALMGLLYLIFKLKGYQVSLEQFCAVNGTGIQILRAVTSYKGF